jgi:SAM-dependent methyltransferase
MAPLDRLWHMARELLRLRASAEPRGAVAERPVGFSSVPGEESIDSMTAEELSAWENRDVPSIHRPSDDVEARADEKQDVTTGLNFPLHWTSATLSWDYLFDFSVAGGLLAPRPDDLILDFAAGTCWATELLGRLGVRTVSVAADSRLVFRDEAAFLVARGQALPFLDDTFDGVLCLNALHHLPSYAAALKEIHRVLKPGGRAVFSEPGTAHAVQPLSMFRMREERVVEKAVSLPLIRRLAIGAGFTRMKVVPLRSSAAYVFEYASANTPASFFTKATIRRPIRCCRRTSLQGGSGPGLFSRRFPRPLVPGTRSRIGCESPTPAVSRGRRRADASAGR